MVDVPTLLASAGVAAVVSALTTLINGKLERDARREVARQEREARRDELLLTRSLDMARDWTEFVDKIAARQNLGAKLGPPIFAAVDILRGLKSLMTTSLLPPDLHEQMEQWKAAEPGKR
jgi:hypothetical protein